MPRDENQVLSDIHAAIYEHFRAQRAALTGQDVAHLIVTQLRIKWSAKQEAAPSAAAAKETYDTHRRPAF